MSSTDSHPVSEEKLDEANNGIGTDSGIESRRKFLKVSAVAGATVAAMAAGLNFLPSITAAAKSSSSSSDLSTNNSDSSNPLIVVINADTLDVYQGESKYTSTDLLFTRSISSQIRARI
jgi:hypothetical protein